VVISNASEFSVLYPIYGALKDPMVYIKSANGGQWQEAHGSSIAIGDGVMRPHEVKTTSVEVPERTTRFKVGLYITSLTWRGRLAWCTAPNRPLAPIGRFLMKKDATTRSATEWSEQYIPGDLTK
jgi:hypothetical protein